jgi:pyridoxine 5-phosphate synthase
MTPPSNQFSQVPMLSVNVNKVAVLRNSRGGSVPSVVKAAQTAVLAGAGGITVHPRPDLRHIHPADCIDIRALLSRSEFRHVEFNIEGNPFAPANARYSGLLEIMRETRPEQATLVPDGDSQITSDHGWRIRDNAERLGPMITQIKRLGARVSLFVDDDIAIDELRRARELGADRIEIYTGPYADAFSAGDASDALRRCADTAKNAIACGLRVNAGHDLSQANLATLIGAVAIDEVSIGHALFDEALYAGLAPTVQAYLAILRPC